MAPHKEEKKLPIIFNEYMFASWNRPNEVSTRLLAPMAKKLGADIYVIDCGWHDEADEPFYYLGRWEESKKRFPHGLKTTLDMISSLGMRTGLWLEPEVVGAKGDAKTIYDDDCYFHRGGKPLIVSNRYQLNFTNPKVTGHLFNVIKGLIDQYGVSYFKLDYNIEPGIGFEMGDKSLGEALLLHNRAYHSFVGSLRKAFPDVIIESCASGGNRLDYLTLDNVDLVSSSDQTDYLIYPYIVANILSAVLPEQSGVWCYPKRDDTLPEKVDYEAINLNCLNTYVGRVHLASRMYLLDEAKQSFIATMLKEYHSFDDLRLSGLPYLPKGFSSFGDSSLAFGLKNQKRAMLLVYAMKGTAPIRIPCGSFVSIKEAFPKKELSTKYEVVGHNLVFYPERDCIARLFEISYE
jgi:alpha-galactosidase